MTVSPTARSWPGEGSGAPLAVDETVILLHPTLPSVGVSIAMEREGASKMTASSLASVTHVTFSRCVNSDGERAPAK